MKLNKFVSSLTAAGLAIAIAASALVGFASAEEDGGTPHYPINKPNYAEWSFSGPFGHWDIGQLQRGLKIYTEVCAACHSLDLVPFRSLMKLGYSEAQAKAFAAEYEVRDGPNADGEMYDRKAALSDHFVGPYANNIEAANANNGAAPPDFSLLAKARAPERGFPTFVYDIFTMYAENGPDYIYSLLTGYVDAPDGVEVSEGTHYNPYYVGGNALAMAPPLEDELVEYTDGTPQTVDQYAQDISAFMMWAAEPKLVERKALGFKVMLFLALFSILLYLTKKKIFAGMPKISGGGSTAAAAGATLAATGAASLVGSVKKTAKPAAKKTARSVAKPASTKRKSVKSTKVRKKAKKKTLRAGIDFIDDVELIDGVGPTIAKRLIGEGAGTLTAVARMSASKLDALALKINAKDRHIKEEWQVQAKEMISGKPPRAKIDQQRVAKLLAKK